jgi:hypothetical protein
LLIRMPRNPLQKWISNRHFIPYPPGDQAP